MEDPIEIGPLETATTEALLSELHRRFDTSVFFGLHTRSHKKRFRQLSISGSEFEAYGLAIYSANIIQEKIDESGQDLGNEEV